MLLNFCHKRRYKIGKSVAAIFCWVLYIGSVSALARVDSNLSYKRPNATVAQNQWGQSGYRPAAGIVYQQPFVYNRNNQTHGQQQWHLNNNLSRPYQQPVAPVPIRSNQSLSNWNQSNYVRNPQPSSYHPYGQTPSVRPQPLAPKQPSQTPYPVYGQGSFNQSRLAGSHPQNSAFGQTFNNKSHPAWPQPPASYVPLNPVHNQVSYNQSRATWPHPSAPLLPNNLQNSASTISNLYPLLPNYPNGKPAVPSNSWTPAANQTLLYPQLPNQNIPQPPSAGNSKDIPIASLQPQPNPQGPHNWHSGGQSALSYGPGYYPPAAVNLNKTTPKNQGGSNPYANMFI